MAKAHEAKVEEQATAPEPAPDSVAAPELAPGSDKEGVRARRGIMMKHLLPPGEWIAANLVSRGKGARALVGRVTGVCTKAERKTVSLPDGTPNETVCLHGTFEAESYLTGEISNGSSVYFPMAYASQIEAVLKADKTIEMVEVDCDVGLEATGKIIGYEWVIIAFRDGEQMSVIKRIKASRSRPDKTMLLTGPSK